jgi:hypothetical protein
LISGLVRLKVEKKKLKKNKKQPAIDLLVRQKPR